MKKERKMNKNNCLLLPRCQNRGRREKIRNLTHFLTHISNSFHHPASGGWDSLTTLHRTQPFDKISENSLTQHTVFNLDSHIYIWSQLFLSFNFFFIFVLSKHDRLSLDKIVLFSNNLFF